LEPGMKAGHAELRWGDAKEGLLWLGILARRVAPGPLSLIHPIHPPRRLSGRVRFANIRGT
jgi:hypothetical protein